MAPQPRWIEPMKATLTKEYFSDPGWIYEPKLDGIRCLCFKGGDEVRLLSRNKLSLNDRFPQLEAALRRRKKDFVFDGEVAATIAGRTSFSLLQQAYRQKVSIVYFVFDLPWFEGRDLRKLPLLERKGILRKAISWTDPLHFVEHVVGDGEAYLEAACEQGLEGIIAKRADSPYVGARSRDWLKFKCVNEQEFVIGGFTDPQRSRIGFGALMVGYYKGDDLIYAGKVGTGFDTKLLRELRAKLDKLEIDTPPFADAHRIPRKGAHWVKPKLVAQVGFAEWTGDGILRHPRFLGLREDKAPREVVRES